MQAKSRTRRLSLMIVAFATVAFAARSARALDPERRLSQYVLTNWSTDQGLPQLSVQQILQSRDGYLWVGTQEGFARFDGFRFAAFDREAVPGMTSTYISAMVEDGRARLWIGTREGGIVRLDGKGFELLRKGESATEGLAGDTIRTLAESPDGTIWIGTTQGLSRFRDDKFENMVLPNDASKKVRVVRVEHDGTVWIGTSGAGVGRMDPAGRWTFWGTSDGLPNAVINSLALESPGNAWVGMPAGGIAHVGPNGVQAYGVKEGLPSIDVRALLFDRDRNLWIGTYSRGVVRLQNGRFEALGTREGLPSDAVVALFEDREGSIWVGTESGGLVQLRAGAFTTWGVPEGMSHDYVMNVTEAKNGALWLGTIGGGVDRLEKGVIEAYSKAQGLPGDIVQVVFEDRDSSMLLGLPGRGIYRLKDGRAAPYLTTEQGLPAGRETYGIFATRDGRLYVSMSGGHFGRVENDRWIEESPPVPIDVLAFHEDNKGALWLGTVANGLVKLEDGKWTTFSKKEGFPAELVSGIWEDEAGTLWLATASGLIRVRDGKIAPFTSRQGLPEVLYYGVLGDDQGNLWMMSNHGALRVSRAELDDVAEGRAPALKQLRAFGRADGMRSQEGAGGRHASAWRGKDGRLWFATARGVIGVDPARIATNPLAPPVVIEQVIANGKAVFAYQSAATSANEGASARVTIAPGNERLEVRFAALSLAVPEKNRVRFRLDGFDRDWIDAEGRRTATYTNLLPGAYRFRVMAANSDGVWNEAATSIELDLRPYFYQTVPFYVAIAALVVLGAGAVFRLRTKALRDRAAELDRLVRERTEQLSEANAHLESLASRDGLTGVANRRALDKALDREWSRLGQNGQPLAIILVDVDHFKAFNDRYGHGSGDDCLRRVAGVLQAGCRRAGDLVARYGGEEFVVLLPETRLDGAMSLALRLRGSVEELRIAHDASPTASIVTISLGVASLVPDPDSDFASLLEAADIALYQAKESGRNIVISADGSSA